MKYMLDTNMIIFLKECIYSDKEEMKLRYKKLKEAFDKIKRDDICVSSITYAELEYGINKSNKREQNRLAVTMLMSQIEILSYDSLAAMHYGEIRSSLEKSGNVIGPNDLLIASHARSRGLILVTNNISEFRRVDGLRIADWT